MQDRFVAAKKNENLLEQPKKLMVTGILQDRDAELKLRMWIGMLENDLIILMDHMRNVGMARSVQLMRGHNIVDKMNDLTEKIFTPLQHGNALITHLEKAYRPAKASGKTYTEDDDFYTHFYEAAHIAHCKYLSLLESEKKPTRRCGGEVKKQGMK